MGASKARQLRLPPLRAPISGAPLGVASRFQVQPGLSPDSFDGRFDPSGASDLRAPADRRR
jgi:hypothetical protein